jgi:hypothetical protein
VIRLRLSLLGWEKASSLPSGEKATARIDPLLRLAHVAYQKAKEQGRK